jgi:hypothetical protein
MLVASATTPTVISDFRSTSAPVPIQSKIQIKESDVIKLTSPDLPLDAWLPASRQPAGRPDCSTDWTLRAVFDLTRWTLPASEPGFGFLSEFWV